MRRWALAPAAIALLIALPVGTLKAKTEDGGRVIHEAETEYQYARVIEYPDGERALELNEGQAQHSICSAECEPGPGGPRSPSSVLTGDVWDGHLVLPFLRRSEPPRRVAILGNAAGTTSRAYEYFFPRTRVDGVEIDGELSDIGREYFDMNNPRLHLYHEDARPFLRRTDASYDVISVDAYRQPYIPFYLTTVEFFETVRDRLAPGGVVIVNAGHPEDQDDLEKVLTATMGEVFPYVHARPDRGHQHADRRERGAALRPRACARRCRTCRPACARPRSARRAGVEEPLTGGDVYTDDKAPVEWLIDKSIVDYASGGDD